MLANLFNIQDKNKLIIAIAADLILIIVFARIKTGNKQLLPSGI
jgi:hypothetical protein